LAVENVEVEAWHGSSDQSMRELDALSRGMQEIGTAMTAILPPPTMHDTHVDQLYLGRNAAPIECRAPYTHPEAMLSSVPGVVAGSIPLSYADRLHWQIVWFEAHADAHRFGCEGASSTLSGRNLQRISQSPTSDRVAE
jgi:hypothetical protein